MSLKTKKLLKLMICAMVLALLVPTASFAQADLAKKLEGSIVLKVGSSTAFTNNVKSMIDEKDTKVTPLVIEGRTLVPVRFISESLGAQVEYDSKTSKVTISLEETKLHLTLGQKKLHKNQTEVALDVPAQAKNGRTYLPLRAIVEALDKKVFYDKGIIIISEQSMTLEASLLERLNGWFDSSKSYFAEDTAGKAYEVPAEDLAAIKKLREVQNEALKEKDIDKLLATQNFVSEKEKKQYMLSLNPYLKLDVVLATEIEAFDIIEASENKIVVRETAVVRKVEGTSAFPNMRTISIYTFVKIDGKWLCDPVYPEHAEIIN